MSRVRETWNVFWFKPRAPYALAVARMVLGYCVLLLLVGTLDPLLELGLPIVDWEGLGSADFSEPYSTYAQNDPSTYIPASFLDWLNVPPPSQTALAIAFAGAFFGAWFLLFGLATRLAAVTTAVSVLYLVGMMNSWGKVNHGYHVLAVALLILLFSRSGDAWSLDALIRRFVLRLRHRPIPERSWRYAWPVTAMQIAFALMFFFAGWNKLITSGLTWAFSENMRNTLVYQNLLVRDWENASWVVRTAVDIDQPWLWYSLGAGGMFTELLFIGIVFARDRPWIRRGLLLLGVSLVAGLDQLMQLPNPVLLTMLLLFVDWNGIQHRVWLWIHRYRGSEGKTDLSPAVAGAGPLITTRFSTGALEHSRPRVGG